ncbi:hypothetical protein HYQ46_011535 [Verticillium longisporum]|nr:hypothetical protein HYQ46_011535 [Verticillium longisporum]
MSNVVAERKRATSALRDDDALRGEPVQREAGMRVLTEEMRPPQTSMRAKHQKRACSRPPEKPVICTASMRLAQPSRWRRQALGEQLHISRTQRTTQDAMTGVVRVESWGRSRWMAS